MDRRRQSLVNMGHAVRLERRPYPCLQGLDRQLWRRATSSVPARRSLPNAG